MFSVWKILRHLKRASFQNWGFLASSLLFPSLGSVVQCSPLFHWEKERYGPSCLPWCPWLSAISHQQWVSLYSLYITRCLWWTSMNVLIASGRQNRKSSFPEICFLSSTFVIFNHSISSPHKGKKKGDILALGSHAQVHILRSYLVHVRVRLVWRAHALLAASAAGGWLSSLGRSRASCS